MKVRQVVFEPVYTVPAAEPDIIAAFKAMSLGGASDRQQVAVLNWLMRDACKINSMSYRPGADGDRDSNFMEGRRFVGQVIADLVNYDLNKTKERK